MSKEPEQEDEEDLNDFLLKASEILSDDNNQEEEIIIKSLKEYLISIIQDKSEMENLFKTLNNLIFSSNQIMNIKPFILYPIIFSYLLLHCKSYYYL